MITQGLYDLPFLGGSSLLRGLTSYWKMDEVLIVGGTRVDSRGTQNLTDVNTNVQYNAGSGILASKFAEFIAADATKFLQASSTPYLANASFTLSGWLNWAATLGGPQIAKWGSTHEYLLWDQTGNTPIKWQAVESGTSTTKSLNVALTGLSGLWAYVTVGYDDINKQLFAYVNAVSQGTTSINGVNTTTEPLVFGNFSPGSGVGDQSGFQDWGFWRRVLSSAEVTRLYNGGAGLAFNQF
jgi:hypothetical protein